MRAGRTAATLAETNVTKAGYRYNYGPEYDTIYLQWMMAYGQATGDPYWLKLARAQRRGGRRRTRRPAAGCGSRAGGAARSHDPETHSNMFRTMAATTSLFAWVAVYSGQHEAPEPSHVAGAARATRRRR